LIPRLVAAGLEVLDPWSAGSAVFEDMGIDPQDVVADVSQLREANQRIGRSNVDMIGRCVAVLSLLDGPDADSGTAAEIGYAAALLRPVVGFRTDLRRSGDNVAAPVNLQVLYFIEASGGRFVTSLDEAVIALLGVAPPAQV
jgi:nucleoside 2-deoxyribosyltransferase